MPPLERSPTPNLPWNQLVAHARQLRAEMRSSLALPFSRMSLVKTRNGCRLYALGTPASSSNQTLLAAEISTDSTSPILLQPLFNPDQFKTATPSHEFSLMCERQRSSVVSGVTDYAIDTKTNTLLLTTGEQVFRFSDGNVRPVAGINSFSTSGGSSFVFDTQFCPSEPKLVSYVLNKQVHLEMDGQLVYRTESANENISNGVPAFITQEELDRFEAVWWSPTKTRLLYERVDETNVKSLMFVCPGKEPVPPMRYPVAGSPNATSELRIINVTGLKVVDSGLKIPLTKRFPWIEYIARAGFLNDGKTIWVQAMERLQCRSSLILIPESDFEGFEVTGPIREATIIRDDFADPQGQCAWINAHNIIVPLDVAGSDVVQFIYASEQKSDCHLYISGANINSSQDVVSTFERPITAGSYSVCKSTGVAIDTTKSLVYFLANVHHPTEWNVCVASYSSKEPYSRMLTEQGLSYRGERAHHRLSLLPDVGFASWMTSLSQPPHCRFYGLIFDSACLLPDARLLAQIALPGNSIPSVVHSEVPFIVEFKSKNSGRSHSALVLRPSNYESGKCYPVLHYVYGGPGIQIVRNDYCAWIPFQKYTKLGFAVVMVDGRGSSNRGTEFEFPIFNKLGHAEIEDQVEGLQEVARLTGDLLDLSRVVIQGWSYGGFMSLLALAKYPQVYRAAIAGGAVTDWRLYDTAYTERYLGFDSSLSYDESSLIRHVDKLPDQPGRLLLIHGLMDENVHFRHTEILIEQMIRAGKPYQLQLFPSERHGIRSSDGAAHLDASMLNFIMQTLKD